jgi:DNA (cytosine-5)-methyltransferase 1
MKPEIVEPFCGIGGLSLGAARAGFTLRASIDVEPTLLDIHRLNFPKSRHVRADVSKLSGTDVKSFLTKKGMEMGTWGLAGGPPCQGFSRIGHRITSDPRNRLFDHFFRLVAESQPAFFVAENVPGILDAPNRHIIDAALALVKPQYKLLPPIPLKASNFGGATIRERVFFIGYDPDRVDTLYPEMFVSSQRFTSAEAAFDGLPDRLPCPDTNPWGWQKLTKQSDSWYAEKMLNGIPKDVGDPEAIANLYENGIVSGCIPTSHTPDLIARYASLAEGERDPISKSQKLRRDQPSPTLRAGTGPDRGSYQAVRPIHFRCARVITPREGARIQGFPDWYRFAPNKWHSFRGIGNSVCPILAETVLKKIRKALKD